MAFATTVGALFVLGTACSGASPAAEHEAAGEPLEAAAGAGEVPAAEPPVLVAAAIADTSDEAVAPQLPDWVVAKLEADPPTLVLSYPAEGATFSESYITFSGKAEPGSTVWAGPYETKSDEHGQWSIGLVLSAGQNVATFTTTSEDGVETKESVTVHFKPKDGYEGSKDHLDGKDYWTKDGVKEGGDLAQIEFQAWQKYGTCSETVPYDVFKGKAAPGTTITVSSQFGEGTAVAGDDGYWHVKVTFEAAPVGEEFLVTVSDGTDVKTFTFTRTK